MTASLTIGGRVAVAAAMGSLTFFLALLLFLAVGASVSAASLLAALAGAGLAGGWLAKRATSLRSAWGRGCLVNGLLCVGVAVGFRVHDDLWVERSQYMRDLDRAVGPLTHFVWELAAWIGLVAFVLATVLFALSYWLLAPPHHKA